MMENERDLMKSMVVALFQRAIGRRIARPMISRVASLLLLASACASVPVLPATKPLLPAVKSVSLPVRPWLNHLGLAPREWGAATQG